MEELEFPIPVNLMFSALQVMKRTAESAGVISGVARIAVLNPQVDYSEGNVPVLALELVVKSAFRPIDPDRGISDTGTNYGAVGSGKWWESFITREDSGRTFGQPMKGELGYRGAVIKQHQKGIIIVSFSGGTQQEDVTIAEEAAALLFEHLQGNF